MTSGDVVRPTYQ